MDARNRSKAAEWTGSPMSSPKPHIPETADQLHDALCEVHGGKPAAAQPQPDKTEDEWENLEAELERVKEQLEASRAVSAAIQRAHDDIEAHAEALAAEVRRISSFMCESSRPAARMRDALKAALDAYEGSNQ